MRIIGTVRVFVLIKQVIIKAVGFQGLLLKNKSHEW